MRSPRTRMLGKCVNCARMSSLTQFSSERLRMCWARVRIASHGSLRSCLLTQRHSARSGRKRLNVSFTFRLRQEAPGLYLLERRRQEA